MLSKAGTRLTPLALCVIMTFACGGDVERRAVVGEVDPGVLVGLWQGVSEFEGREVRVELDLNTAGNGEWSGVLHLRDLGLIGMPFQSVAVEDGGVTTSSPIGIGFQGRVTAEGTLEGQLDSSGEVSPITLERGNPSFRRFSVPRLTEGGEVERTYSYRAPKATGDGWAVSTAEEEGVDVENLEALVESVLREEHGHVEAMVIARNGKLVAEEYFHGFTSDRLHSIQSVTKSVTSLLFGIARDRELIGHLATPAYTFFPEYAGKRWIDEEYDISLKHLLTMSAAIEWNETVPYSDPTNSNTAMNATDDWIGYVLDRGRADVPGGASSYTSGLSIMIGGIIHNATGRYVDEFAEETLFADLGVSAYQWFSAADGTRHTGGGLNLTARDLAKMGQLVLNGGTWNGKRVVSESWIRESTADHLPVAGSETTRYGYQWWRQQHELDGTTLDAIAGLGYGGQYLGVLPSLNTVIVLNAGEYFDAADREFDYRAVVDDLILPAIR